jgi:hypothetical protein
MALAISKKRHAMKQSEKYHLSLAGEYFVTAELQRRGVHASITYGNAKKADVIAFRESLEIAVKIEVKSTGQDRWLIGPSIPPQSDDLWVFVHIPTELSSPPSYFILTQTELHSVLTPLEKSGQDKYREKHGRPFAGKSVMKFWLKQAQPYREKWETISKSLDSPGQSARQDGSADSRGGGGAFTPPVFVAS